MIIGISGKIGSGKDLVGRIIQHFTMPGIGDTKCPDWLFHFDEEGNSITNAHLTSDWKIKKFADKLKDIVCLLIGCTREQLEDRVFKETPLGEEWNYYKVWDNRYNTKIVPVSTNLSKFHDAELVQLTPRLLLQLLGTQCGRDIIHPNIWINALFADYKPIYPNFKFNNSDDDIRHIGKNYSNSAYPNWIITDVRFPNEAEAILKRGGLLIRVERPFIPKAGDNIEIKVFSNYSDVIYTHTDEKGNHYGVGTDGFKYKSPTIRMAGQHESETALDSFPFGVVIKNDQDILSLVEKVKQVLIQYQIIS